jgi:hypothetical protein
LFDLVGLALRLLGVCFGWVGTFQQWLNSLLLRMNIRILGSCIFGNQLCTSLACLLFTKFFKPIKVGLLGLVAVESVVNQSGVGC